MMTVEQFCGAVELSGPDGCTFTTHKNRIISLTCETPVCDLLSGVRIPKYIRDACDGKNLNDAKTKAARTFIEHYFTGDENGDFNNHDDLIESCKQAAIEAGIVPAVAK